METDFVSEVDRKFFANNMLSHEDWETTAASLELTELMGIESDLPCVDFINDIPDSIPLEDPCSGPLYSHDDLLNEWSDSSDSGVSGLLTSQSPASVVKNEPLSPASPTLSHHSDSCDSGISQVADFNQYTYCLDSISPEVSQDAFVQEVAHNAPGKLELPVSSVDFINTAPKTESASLLHKTVIKPCTTPASDVHIDTILNSKIKIQPKPESTTDASSPKRPRTAAQDPGSTQKSLVLTAEEFQRLTSQGVLRFQPPVQETAVAPPVVLPSPLALGTQGQTTVPTTLNIGTQGQATVPSTLNIGAQGQTTATHIYPVTSSHSGNGLILEDNNSKALKRQQRMIKNRESASLSRKRKKEYMTSLESQLYQFSEENERLKQENLTLKQKLQTLHSENESLKKTFSVSPAVKKTLLLSFCLFFVLNLSSLSSVMLSTKVDLQSKASSAPLVHKGRQLMSVSDVAEMNRGSGYLPQDTISRLQKIIMDYGDPRGVDGTFNATDVPPMCPTYFNRTESMRLAEQLAGWMYRHEEEKLKTVKKKGDKKAKQLRPISTLRRAMRGDIQPSTDRKLTRPLDARYQLQVFEGADTGKDFLKALHRRNDTFYVLSFDEDYYLVPAVYHNKTSRPRMSLVMPAVARNESMMPSDDQVGMMQIDCEVMNTQHIHVRKSAIPRHVRERHNVTHPRYSGDERFYP